MKIELVIGVFILALALTGSSPIPQPGLEPGWPNALSMEDTTGPDSSEQPIRNKRTYMDFFRSLFGVGSRSGNGMGEGYRNSESEGYSDTLDPTPGGEGSSQLRWILKKLLGENGLLFVEGMHKMIYQIWEAVQKIMLIVEQMRDLKEIG